MIAAIKRVKRFRRAEVCVDGESVGAIGQGILALVAVEKGETEAQALQPAERVLGYRIFGHSGDKMNLSVADSQGGVLLVSQFTLAADIKKGMRPSFTPAADQGMGKCLFVGRVTGIATDRCGSCMGEESLNYGPVILRLSVKAGDR